MKRNKTIITFQDASMFRKIMGTQDNNLKLLQDKLHLDIQVKNGKFYVYGKQNKIDTLKKILSELKKLYENATFISTDEVMEVVTHIHDKQFLTKRTNINSFKNYKSIVPKTEEQQQYMDLIQRNVITFAIGMAGTGKTVLAVAKAVQALNNKEIDKIVITRPVVEAGESLGFLPGDIKAKIDPYLAPIYDSLFMMIDPKQVTKLLEDKVIEIIPLAYMRGRTVSNAYIIFDEAQNSTKEQMKMFLTRIGINSKAVITGDITQVDLPNFKQSGLSNAINLFKDIPNIAFASFTEKSISRNPVISDILKAYEKEIKINDIT